MGSATFLLAETGAAGFTGRDATDAPDDPWPALAMGDCAAFWLAEVKPKPRSAAGGSATGAGVGSGAPVEKGGSADMTGAASAEVYPPVF